MVKKEQKMKKLIIIAMIISSTLSIVGCSLSKQINQESDSSSTVEAKQEDNLGSTQDTSDKENDNNKSKESKNNDVNQKPNDTTTNKTDKKEYYTQRLNDIQAKIDKDYNFNNAITTKDMRIKNNPKNMNPDCACAKPPYLVEISNTGAINAKLDPR